ncbi:MAG: hypothetical protein ACKPEA_09405, partial [Planctomycetota bacterium]
ITKLPRQGSQPQAESADRRGSGSPDPDGRDPRRDLLHRDATAWTRGHKRGFKRGRRGRKSR